MHPEKVKSIIKQLDTAVNYADAAIAMVDTDREGVAGIAPEFAEALIDLQGAAAKALRLAKAEMTRR